ncbi:DUF2397 domain-containing protein [Herbidospora sp. NBRC 101105]|uniref:DUF2397 domain-containing protein n=1 Tax=Herbidospora sp. NBRC 101105 TaxID=3032195 RepID=UPI0024A4BAE9|nr:DUF2397 domain-containing protein [Herbidospora sp. NBRC 101105]GLX97655.1 hypothetical protein Hesp01_56050 [Herbidospora sp. NBRC 101105]
MPDDEGERTSRLDHYRYATADYADQYIALMRLFTGTLMTDLSAAEAAALLREEGIALSTDDVEDRCAKLRSWGNLVPSVRDARVTSVNELIRSRSRYQVSKLGGLVHRQVEEVLNATGGAREVARELLGGTVDLLDRILSRLSAGRESDAEALAADVTTVFNNQRLFTDSVRDFYAYLHQVLVRYDLAGSEYAQFKSMLLAYVDLITADVARHAPAVADRLTRIAPQLDRLLGLLDTLPGLQGHDGTPAERSPGRNRSEWDQLIAWYDGQSGPARLRSAAERALGQLITNAKRMLAAGGTGVSRRSDLLKLARWFAEADDQEAHRIFAAAFGAYPSRHLALGPAEPDAKATPGTSWLAAAPVRVPVSLRERGDRNARGRDSRVPDPAAHIRHHHWAAERDRAGLTAAVAELLAAGDLDGSRLSTAAWDVLLDHLGRLFAAASDETGRSVVRVPDLGFELHGRAGDLTRISTDGGTAVLSDLGLQVIPLGGSATG